MSRVLFIPLLLIALLAGAITWSRGSVEKPADFSFINRGDIITLDINRMSYLQDIRMAYALWEGLYTYDNITLEPIPGAAKSVDISDDKRVYTFHLRPEARWSNGDPVTARDFVFSWRRMLESPGEYTYLHFYIKGAEEYSNRFVKGEPVNFSTVGLETPDDHTLRVTLENPVTFFLDLVAFSPFLPLNKKSMEAFEVRDEKGRVRYDMQFTRPPNLVGNGPYKLVEWEFKRHLRLEANPYYWDRENVKSQSIEMVVVEDPLTVFKRYDFGKVDWLAAVPSEMAPELRAAGRPDLHIFPGFGTRYLHVNCNPTFNDGRPNPMVDMRVRQALAMAIDKQNIVDTVTRMGEEPATTFIPPGIFAGYQTTPAHSFDPERARELLAEAGFPNGQNFPTLTMVYVGTDAATRDMVQNLRRQWHDRLGINVALESMETRIYRQRINDTDFAVAPGGWYGDYGDPSTFTDKYRSNSENNDSKWFNDRFDALCKQATEEPDAEKRLRLLEEAERILNHEVPVIPLYHYVNAYMFRDNVKGLNLSPRHIVIFKSIYVERE